MRHTFASTTAGKGNGNNINCSRLRPANRHGTIVPAPARMKAARNPDNARCNTRQQLRLRTDTSGKRVITIRKNHSGLAISALGETLRAAQDGKCARTSYGPLCVSEMRRILLSATLSGWWVSESQSPPAPYAAPYAGSDDRAVNVNRGKRLVEDP